MRGLLFRLLIGALGLWLAALLVPGIQIQGIGTLLLAALLLGIVNAVVRPLLIILTLPITVLTLGLFLLVVNAAMLGLVASLLADFSIRGFFAALFGALILSLTGWIASWYIGSNGRVEVLLVRGKRLGG